MVTDDDNPMLLRKKEVKKNPLWDFSSVPSSVHPSQYLKKTPSRLERLLDTSRTRPYVTIRDLNNPSGDDEGRTPRPAVEIGIKGTF